MKFILLSLFFAVVDAIELRGAPAADDILKDQIRAVVQNARAKGPVRAETTDDILQVADHILTAVQHARAEGFVGAATTDNILADQNLTAVQHAKSLEIVAATAEELRGATRALAESERNARVAAEAELRKATRAFDAERRARRAAEVELAATNGLLERRSADLAAVRSELAELKRQAGKKCDNKRNAQQRRQARGDKKGKAKKSAVPSPAPAAAPGAPAASATTTTTTPPCPDNFMDEIVDQANPEFDMFDTNKDGCLEDGELTATLKKQIEIARHRDYYWIRRNITDAARNLIKAGKKTHAAADENDSGCLNRQELDIVHHAICDCKTQFMFMDHNADGKISQQEASTFVSDEMPQADLNYVTLKKIFKAADVDGSKYLSEKEFCEAGPKYKGDGPQYSTLPGPTPQVATGKHWLPPAPVPAPAPAPAF